MDLALSFNDVIIKPQWSTIESRKDVNVSISFANRNLRLPVLSSNMDSVTGPEMAKAMNQNGGKAILHRFHSIIENVKQFENSPCSTWASVGIGNSELERALALVDAGCGTIVLDVAHGAAMHVVKQTKALYDLIPTTNIVVGNFATGQSIKDFNYHLGRCVEAYKCNVGSGSACITRQVTGCGIPSFTSLKDCVSTGFNIIQDGGIKNSGDFAKAMGLGAKACILGGMLAGTDESLAEPIHTDIIDYSKLIVPIGKDITSPDCFHPNIRKIIHKRYRGSASQESYEVQGKTASHRSAEGEAFLVPYVGSVKDVLQSLEGGLRSAMSYVGARNLEEFKERCEFIRVTDSAHREGSAHQGKL